MWIHTVSQVKPAGWEETGDSVRGLHVASGCGVRPNRAHSSGARCYRLSFILSVALLASAVLRKAESTPRGLCVREG